MSDVTTLNKVLLAMSVCIAAALAIVIARDRSTTTQTKAWKLFLVLVLEAIIAGVVLFGATARAGTALFAVACVLMCYRLVDSTPKRRVPKPGYRPRHLNGPAGAAPGKDGQSRSIDERVPSLSPTRDAGEGSHSGREEG